MYRPIFDWKYEYGVERLRDKPSFGSPVQERLSSEFSIAAETLYGTLSSICVALFVCLDTPECIPFEMMAIY